MRFLKATTDIAFKKLFGDQKRADLTISFLNSVLERKEGEKITSVTINDPTNHPQTVDKKVSFVDVSCTDQANKKYIIEIQVIDEKNFIERAQYYAAVQLARQLSPADQYQKLVPVIFVGVVCYNLFNREAFLSHYRLQEERSGARDLNLLEFHFIELKKFTKQLEELATALDKWLYLLKEAHDMITIPSQFKMPHEMEEALCVLEEGAWTESEYNSYMVELDEWRGKESLEQAAHTKGKTDGKIEIAKKMLFAGLETKLIMEITGLTPEEISLLK